MERQLYTLFDIRLTHYGFVVIIAKSKVRPLVPTLTRPTYRVQRQLSWKQMQKQNREPPLFSEVFPLFEVSLIWYKMFADQVYII